jgi:hypothetical protein
MNQKITTLIIACAAYILFNPTTLSAQNKVIDYGTDRRPRTCNPEVHKTKGKLTVARAKMYFICDKEHEASYIPTLTLVNDLNLQLAPKSRRANGADLKFSHKHGGTVLAIDFDKPVYDIRVSYIDSVCFGGKSWKVGKNCNVGHYSGTGICFKDTFDEWHCRAIGNYSKYEREVAPPGSDSSI